MEICEFRSAAPNRMIALRGGHTISFASGVFRTDDPEIAKGLREICAVESRGNRAVVESGGTYGVDSPLVGTVLLRLMGCPEETIHLHGENISQLAMRIATLVSQSNPHRDSDMADPFISQDSSVPGTTMPPKEDAVNDTDKSDHYDPKDPAQGPLYPEVPVSDEGRGVLPDASREVPISGGFERLRERSDVPTSTDNMNIIPTPTFEGDVPRHGKTAESQAAGKSKPEARAKPAPQAAARPKTAK